MTQQGFEVVGVSSSGKELDGMIISEGIRTEAVEMTYGFATKVYTNSRGLYDFIVKGNYAKREKLHVIANGAQMVLTPLFSRPTLFQKKRESNYVKI